MKAIKANLLQFLQRSGHLEIPAYQRNYSWTVKQCRQLWDDVVKLAENGSFSNHFLGSIIYMEKDITHISAINTCYLIDGGQRLITLSLLLSALGRIMEETEQKSKITLDEINNYYLINSDETGNLRYKLGLNATDRDTFSAVIDNKDDIPANHSERIIENYLFLKECIEESHISPDRILSVLFRIEIIDIALQKDTDDPQLIFNSINSTGVSLTRIDQVRNHALMGLNKTEQEMVYTNYWTPMEQAFKETGDTDLFERYINTYLSIYKNGEIADIEGLYFNFKEFFTEKQKFQKGRDVVKHIYQYSRYFLKLVNADDRDSQIKRTVESINAHKGFEAYPFLMEVYDDYENGLITREIFLEILKNTEAYVSKRTIQDVASNRHKEVFATLSCDINKILAQKAAPQKIADLQPTELEEKIREAEVAQRTNPFSVPVREKEIELINPMTIPERSTNPILAGNKKKTLELPKALSFARK